MTAVSSVVDLIARAPVHLTLADGTARVADPVRVERWERSSTSINSTVTFGPYSHRVEADSVLVQIDGGEPDVIPLGDRLSLPAGVTFTYDVTLGVRAGN